MSQMYKINFSSDEIAITGKTLKEEKDNAIRRFRDELKIKKVDPDTLDEKTIQEEADRIVSTGENEKKFLSFLFQSYANTKTPMETFLELLNNVKQLKECKESSIIFSQTDIERLKKAFESLPDKKAGFDLPEIVKQIAKPKEITEEVNKIADQKE
jgi:hypothetical protein